MKDETRECFPLSDAQHEHRWGFGDTKFILNPQNNVVSVTGHRYAISGYNMPYFIPFIEKKVTVPLCKEKRSEKFAPLPKSKLSQEHSAVLRNNFANAFSLDEKDRCVHSHGQTTADEIMKVLYGEELDRYADGVVYCKKKADVSKIIKLALQHKWVLVPYGGGTSVSCALQLPKKEKRPIVVVNVTGLSRIFNIDEENMRVTVGSGITGLKLEEALNHRGLTLGHEPDSLEFSTVGGWIATNASGMKKNCYGNIEDIVENFTLVTPSGEIRSTDMHPRISSGMQMQKLLFGNEGNLGIITDAALKIFKKPEVKKYESLLFHSFEVGVNFLKDMRDVKNLPASIRLVDNLQFQFAQSLRRKIRGLQKLKYVFQKAVLKYKKFDIQKLVTATIVLEGTREEVAVQKKIIARKLRKYGGMFGGEANGKRGYELTYAIAYIRDFMSDHYFLGETYETTVPWNRIHEVCDTVQRVAEEQHAKSKFVGRPLVSARITQLYQTGVCIYFTHGLNYIGIKNPEAKFAKMERNIREAIIAHGGSISHHHGVGKIRSLFAKKLFNSSTRLALQSIKNALDPENVMGIQNNIFLK